MFAGNIMAQEFKHENYSMGFRYGAAAATLPPAKISLKPGRRWLARVRCRLRGHIGVLDDGKCPRCRTVIDTERYIGHIGSSIRKAARDAEEETIRHVFGDSFNTARRE
jgi:hypothetical protein